MRTSLDFYANQLEFKRGYILEQRKWKPAKRYRISRLKLRFPRQVDKLFG